MLADAGVVLVVAVVADAGVVLALAVVADAGVVLVVAVVADAGVVLAVAEARFRKIYAAGPLGPEASGSREEIVEAGQVNNKEACLAITILREK